MLGIDSRLKDLNLYETCLEQNKLTRDAYLLFNEQKNIPGIILLSNEKFTGMISRKRFFEIMSRPFSLELYLKRTLETLFNEFNFSSCILPDNTYISDASRIALQRESDQIWEPVIIKSGNSLKLLDIDELLIAHSEVHSFLIGKLERSMAYVNNLLNNTGEGLLTFDENLMVEPSYSIECKSIFGKDIYAEYIPDLFYPRDSPDNIYFSKILKSILKKNSKIEIEIYIPLLPEELIINNKNINIRYKVINNPDTGMPGKMMLILTDITEKKNLENAILKERNLLSMILKIIIDKKEFIELKEEYESFYTTGVFEILRDENNFPDSLHEILRIIHTFKGNFAQFDLANTTEGLHNLETEIIKFEKEGKTSIQNLRQHIKDSALNDRLNDDLSLLNKKLGETFLINKNTITLEIDEIKKIEDEILTIPNSAIRLKILNKIKLIQALPFKTLLKSYPPYFYRLAEKIEKPINQFDIEGENIKVNPDYYREFCKTLSHVFRNALIHGIEDPEERLLKRKDGRGNINCSISAVSSNILLRITDDGRGIDIDKIKETASGKGYAGIENMNVFDENTIISLIFQDGFSTKTEVTNHSGRGYGLSAVNSELDKIKGKVKIITKKDIGTEFQFILPIVI
jgi:two-component system, chemotaxis family, sensor kinase CheA